MQFEPVHFLLVDDLEENLIALEALLRRDGLVLLKAKSGLEALELLLKYDVALAFLDIQMPGMDGFELAEFMRGKQRTKCVPIIFLTAGSADKQRRFRGYEAGAVDFLQKPIEPDIIRGKAGVFFELFRRRQEIARQRDKLAIATRESQNYAAALKEADQRKDEFLAMLAHELRTPLTPIRNGLEILRQQPEGETAANVRDIIDRQLTLMVRLIDDLLDMSRVSKGKIDLRRNKVTVQSAIISALEAANSHISERQQQLRVNMPEREIWVEADTTRLSQIVGNLLNNATKYTPEGGHIELTVQDSGDQAAIIVTDDGVGIPEDMRLKIFDLFTQVNSSQEQTHGGLGIGLALVKHLVELHQGTIEVVSAGLNQGSTFTVYMPLVEAPQPSEVSLDHPQISKPTRNLNILIVDDNVASAQTTGWMLEMLGYHYTLSHDGPEALALAYKLQPDAILLDIGLPSMNGYEVCRELRKNPLFENTLIIAQTGWGQKRDRDMAKEAGFNHHLVKPLKLAQIIELLA